MRGRKKSDGGIDTGREGERDKGRKRKRGGEIEGERERVSIECSKPEHSKCRGYV